MNASQNQPAALDRRAFFRRAGAISGAAALAPAALGVTAGLFLNPRDTDAAPLPFGTDLDIAVLNFALNLEYLEGEYYNLGVTGAPVEALGIDTTGSGTLGGLTVKTNPKVPFVSDNLRQYATEIAADEAAHIRFLRTTITALGGTPVARPEINFTDAFNMVSRNAGLDATFDPFANEANFFLGALSLTDVGVTAYKGAAPLLTNKAVISGSAGILAVESYHDSILRLTNYRLGDLARAQFTAISNLRDSLDTTSNDKDQPTVDNGGNSNIVPTDNFSIAFGRTTRQVLNIVYGGFKARGGLFFPLGLNGAVR